MVGESGFRLMKLQMAHMSIQLETKDEEINKLQLQINKKNTVIDSLKKELAELREKNFQEQNVDDKLKKIYENLFAHNYSSCSQLQKQIDTAVETIANLHKTVDDFTKKQQKMEMKGKLAEERIKKRRENLPQEVIADECELERKYQEENMKAVKSQRKEKLAKEKDTSVLTLGGSYQDTIEQAREIWIFNSEKGIWQELSLKIPIRNYSFGTVVLNYEIYIIGGWSNATDNLPHNLAYKLTSDGWVQLTSLIEPRNNISNSCVVFEGEIWAIGGSNMQGNLSSVEKYNPKMNCWIKMPKMNVKRRNAAAAVHDGKIYVSGGYEDHGGSEMSIEFYDPTLKKWQFANALPVRIAAHCMLEIDGELTILGGNVDNAYSSAVWKKRAGSDEWEKSQPMGVSRLAHGAANINGNLMVFGGIGGYCKHLDSVEIFDKKNKSWKAGTPLIKTLGFFGFTAIPRCLEKSLLQKFT